MFLISTPAIVFVVNYADRLPVALRVLAIAAIVAIGLSLFDVMGRANYATFMSWSSCAGSPTEQPPPRARP